MARRSFVVIDRDATIHGVCVRDRPFLLFLTGGRSSKNASSGSNKSL